MPRQKKERCCALELKENVFKPRGIELSKLEFINLELDELEAIYLCDYMDNDQTQAAEQMGVSRGTVQRLLYSGRKKLVDFIVNNKGINITTGDHIVPPSCTGKQKRHRRGKGCGGACYGHGHGHEEGI